MKRYSNDYFSKKTVLLVGGYRKSGMHTARVLAARGAAIQIIGTDKDGLSAARAELEEVARSVRTVQVDSNDPMVLEAAVQGLAQTAGVPDVILFCPESDVMERPQVRSDEDALHYLGPKFEAASAVLSLFMPVLEKREVAHVVFITEAITGSPFRFVDPGLSTARLKQMLKAVGYSGRKSPVLFHIAEQPIVLESGAAAEPSGYRALPDWVRHTAIPVQRMAGIIIHGIERGERRMASRGARWVRFLHQRVGLGKLFQSGGAPVQAA